MTLTRRDRGFPGAAGLAVAALLAFAVPYPLMSSSAGDAETTSTSAAPGVRRIGSLAELPAGLIGVSSTEPGVIYSISPSTGAASALVSMNGGAAFTGASFLGKQLYATDLSNYPGQVSSRDIGSLADDGTITFLSDQASSINWHGLASDEGRQVLYSMDTLLGLLQVQQLDGTVVSVGPGTGIDGRGMAYDDGRGVLYATNNSDLSLYSVDVTTGLATVIGPLGLGFAHGGLAYDESTQTLYLVNQGTLYTLDVTTGSVATVVGPTGAPGDIDGLAWKNPLIFADSFESGDTSAWSGSVP